MFTEIRSFTDSQQHAGSILGWRQTYDQLGRGSLNSELWQASSERFQIFQEVLNKRVVQHGIAPKGRLCIALLLGAVQAPVIQQHEVGAQNVVLLRDGEEFLLHSPESTRFLGVNVDTVRFAKLAALELPAKQLDMLRKMPQVSVPELALQRIQRRISPLFRSLLLKDSAAISASTEKMIEDNLLDAFLDLFSCAVDERRSRHGNLTVSSYLVKRSQELALENIDTPLTVLDLCEKLRVSRRTLQNSFQAVSGIRPLEYLRNLRLNAVRRRLMNTSIAQHNVGEVAGEMGFYHLSHFATNYLELFGEYPSETKRAQS